jgi:hypothetical protein
MKFFSRLAFIILFLGIVFFFISKRMDNFYQNNYVICNKSNWILTKKNSSYYFGIIGSSRALNNVYVPSMDSALGRKGINLGLSGANYAENYLTLREFLNHGNKLDLLFIQADVYGMDSPNAYSYPFNDYNYVFSMNDDTVSEIFKDHVKPLKFYLWKYVPYAKYAEFSNKYSFYKFLKKGYNCSAADWDETGGSELLHPQKNKEDDLFKENKNELTYKINPSDSVYLGKLIQLCVANKITVRLFTAPEKKDFIAKQVNRNEIYNVINGITNKFDVPACYTEWQDTNYVVDPFFRDNTHLTGEGAKIFSVLLAKKIEGEFLANQKNN